MLSRPKAALLPPQSYVISTGGGAFAAEVERPLYFAFFAVTYFSMASGSFQAVNIADSIRQATAKTKYRGLSTSLRSGRDDVQPGRWRRREFAVGLKETETTDRPSQQFLDRFSGKIPPPGPD
jgi:hypothetical protein